MEDQYHTYTPLQIAGEESFIRWTLYAEKDDQWSRWMKEDPVRQNTVAEARDIVLSLSGTPVPTFSSEEKTALWNQIRTRIQADKQEPKRRAIQPFWKWAVAAAATFALVVWFNSLLYSDNMFAGAGEQKEFIFPEESKVTLNAGSYIQYKEKNFEEKRNLFLDGEAFFTVTSGNTFVVKTEYGSITVLGTSFNIISREGRMEVSCYTGKVKVLANQAEPLVLTAGEKVKYTKAEGTLLRSEFIPAGKNPEWMNGKFTFEDQRLEEVFAEFERQYNVKVKLAPGIGDLKYTGLFESGDLEKALSLITWPLHLTTQQEGNTIIISR